jgi:tetratricopeptide (TPR) repeat protein
MTYKNIAIWALLATSCLWANDLSAVRFKQAQTFESQGKHDKALEEYRAVLLSDPNNAKAYLGAGNARFQLNSYNAALKNFELAAKKDPSLWNAVEGMAKSYEALGQKEKAVAEWRRLADNGPKDQRKQALSRIEGLLGKGGSSAKANSEVLPVKTEPATPVAVASKGKFQYDGPLFNKALSVYQAGDYRKSLDLWKKVLDAQPGNPGAYYYAGVSRYNLGDNDKAIYNLQRSFSYPDKGNNAHYYLGRIYEKQKMRVRLATIILSI